MSDLAEKSHTGGYYCTYKKIAFILKTMLVILFQWIHLASGHRCVSGKVFLCIIWVSFFLTL